MSDDGTQIDNSKLFDSNPEEEGEMMETDETDLGNPKAHDMQGSNEHSEPDITEYTVIERHEDGSPNEASDSTLALPSSNASPSESQEQKKKRNHIKRLKEQNKELKELKEEINRLKEGKVECEETIRRLQVEIERLKRIHAELNETNTQIAEENIRIQQNADEKMNTLKALNDRLAQENNRLGDLLKQFESKNKCIPKLQEEINEMKKEIDGMKTKTLSAEDAHKKAMAKSNQAWNSLFNKVKAEKESAVKKLDKEIQDLKNETSKLKNEKENAVKKLDKDIQDLKNGKAALQQKINVQETVINDKKKENDNFVASVKVMKEQYDAREKAFNQTIKNLSDGKSQAEHLVMEKNRCIEQMKTALQNHVSTINNHVSTIQSLEKDKKDLTLRLSKLAGANLTYNNPNIADLSDENRPTKLAEKFSELYDNEWTDAFEVCASQLCHDTSRNHMDAIKSSLSTLVIQDLWTEEEEEEPEEKGEKSNTEKTDQQDEHLSCSKNDKGKDESVTVAKDSDISGNQTSSKTNGADGINIDNRTKDENAKYQTERKMVKMTGRSKRDSKPDVRHVAPDSDDEKNGERLYTSGNETVKTPDAIDNKSKHPQITGSTKRCSMNGKGLYMYPLTLSADFDQIASEQKKIVMEIRKYFECHLSKQFYKVGSDIIEKAMGIDQHAQESVVKYIEKCMTICWSMSRHEPPVHIEFPETEGDLQYDTNLFKPYTRTGTHLDFVVWPALYLHENGPILAKGVAQGRK